MYRVLPAFVYRCPGCGIRLTTRGLPADSWATCPSCERPSLPPDILPDLLVDRPTRMATLHPLDQVEADAPEPESTGIPLRQVKESMGRWPRAEVTGGTIMFPDDSPTPTVVAPHWVRDAGPAWSLRRTLFLLVFLGLLALIAQRLGETEGRISFEIVVYVVIALLALVGLWRREVARSYSD